jgi:membrane fusion protein
MNLASEAKEPGYRVRVELSRQFVRAFGDQWQLQPGLRLKARIVLEQRSLMDWLLEPIRAISNRT